MPTIYHYLDCYMQNDLDGFPTSTYKIDVDEGVLNQIVTQLNKYYYRVEQVQETNGQAVMPLTIWLKSNPSFIG